MCSCEDVRVYVQRAALVAVKVPLVRSWEKHVSVLPSPALQRVVLVMHSTRGFTIVHTQGTSQCSQVHTSEVSILVKRLVQLQLKLFPTAASFNYHALTISVKPPMPRGIQAGPRYEKAAKESPSLNSSRCDQPRYFIV